MYNGSCLCSAVHYRLKSEPFDCCYCSCSICRKLTGSTNGAYGSVTRDVFVWTKGEHILSRYSPTKITVRTFCSVCGSFLLTEHSAEPRNVFVSLGTLDSNISVRPEYQQFAKDLPEWAHQHNDLTVYDGWPGQGGGQWLTFALLYAMTTKGILPIEFWRMALV